MCATKNRGPEMLSLPAKVPGGSAAEVHEGDATMMPFPEAFHAVVCFTMLHHVQSAAAQDGVFREVVRVLRPNPARQSGGGQRVPFQRAEISASR